MKIVKLLMAAIIVSTFGANAHAAPMYLQPTILTMDVRDCGANRSMPSSVKLTTKFNNVNPGTLSLRFDFRNIANGQISTFEYNTFKTNLEMSLPGGYYTFIAYYKSNYAVGVYPKSVQLHYDTPVVVPQISASGACMNVVDPRVK